jgi:hypothetical protein
MRNFGFLFRIKFLRESMSPFKSFRLRRPKTFKKTGTNSHGILPQRNVRGTPTLMVKSTLFLR